MRALLAPSGEQPALIRALLDGEDARLLPVLEGWRSGEVFLHEATDGTRVPFMLTGDALPDGSRIAVAIETGQPLAGPDGAPLSFQSGNLTPLDTSAAIRRAIRDVTEVAGLSDPDPATRRAAAERLGLSQRVEHLPILEARAARSATRPCSVRSPMRSRSTG